MLLAEKKQAMIPRPFCGDVVVYDAAADALLPGWSTGGQPLVCALTSQGRLIARDWQSGSWLEPRSIRPRRRFWFFS